jgi:hypothetical protein
MSEVQLKEDKEDEEEEEEDEEDEEEEDEEEEDEEDKDVVNDWQIKEYFDTNKSIRETAEKFHEYVRLKQIWYIINRMDTNGLESAKDYLEVTEALFGNKNKEEEEDEEEDEDEYAERLEIEGRRIDADIFKNKELRKNREKLENATNYVLNNKNPKFKGAQNVLGEKNLNKLIEDYFGGRKKSTKSKKGIRKSKKGVRKSKKGVRKSKKGVRKSKKGVRKSKKGIRK